MIRAVLVGWPNGEVPQKLAGKANWIVLGFDSC
jgi:hypothetical protein